LKTGVPKMEWWDTMIAALGSLPSSIIDYFFNQAGGSLRNILGDIILFDTWALLGGFTNMISRTDAIFSSPAVYQIYEIIKAVSYSFIALFFVIDLCKKAAYFETTTIESVIKPVLMLIVGKLMIDNAMWILRTIGEINTLLVTSIISLTGNLNDVFGYSALTTTLESRGGVNLFFMSIIFVVFALLLVLGVIGMYVMLVIRQIELGILVCVSPLFFSTLVADVTNEIFKAFIKNFIVVCFQTTVMAIACVLFYTSIQSFISGTATGIFVGFIETVIGIMGLTFFILKSKSLLRESMGVGGSGGVSVTSIARLFV
jgi:hypothetical protein